MKKILLILFALTLSVVSCDFDYDLRVEATGTFLYPSLASEIATGVYDRGFHSRTLSVSQVEIIYHDLSLRVAPDFSSAILHMEIYNQIGNTPMGVSEYSVLPNGDGGVDIQELTAEY